MTKKKNANNQKVKLEVVYEEYVRYGCGDTVKAIIERDTLLEALKDMVGNMGLYLTREDIEENEMSADDILESIEESNGDGCDMIFSIKDLLTNKTLLDSGVEEGGFVEVDW